MTDGDGPRIVSLGDSALLVEFGNEIDADLNAKSLGFCKNLEAEPFRGFIEAVPAYASAAVIYDAPHIQRNLREFSSPFEFVKSHVLRALAAAASAAEGGRDISIAVSFGGEDGPDLADLAVRCGLTESGVVEIFCGRAYRVYMLGFLPGFSYMGEVDDRIATPRRSVPRKLVPKGSVGIAGKQTGIYSLDSPGGWQIIGRTNQAIFLPESEPPSFLRPGDNIRFVQA
jgi:inhibitor of KinA